VGHPIDTIKVVQQVTNDNVKKTIKDIYNQDKANKNKLIKILIIKLNKI